MYKLFLTADERRAIDWIGDRYSHGNDLYSLLWGECYPNVPNANWYSPVDIGFNVPEYTAWEIRRIAEEDNYLWTCFSPKFAEKMNDFCNKIV